MRRTEEAFACTTMAFGHLQQFFVLLVSGNSAFYSWHSPCISSMLSSALEGVREQAFQTTSVSRGKLKVLVRRTDRLGRLVAAQVTDCNLTAQELAGRGNLESLCHSFVCF